MNSKNNIYLVKDAVIHVSRTRRNWFQKQEIEVLKRPVHSRDLNPIGNMWGNSARRVYAGGVKLNVY